MIATLIGTLEGMRSIDAKTLRRWYRDELDVGLAKQVSAAGAQLHNAVMRGEAWAICFTLKTKGGYREVDRGPRRDETVPIEALLPAPTSPGHIPAQLAQTINAEDAMREYLQHMRPKAPALPQLAAPVSQQ
jgi:hypothetical protein